MERNSEETIAIDNTSFEDTFESLVATAGTSTAPAAPVLKKGITEADAALTAAVESGDKEKIEKAASEAFGTRQWADQTINIISGCKVGCLGCFAAEIAYRYKRVAAGEWTKEKLNERALDAKVPSGHKLTMFPSAHNISPEFLEPCEKKIQQILDSGSDILIVIKPWRVVVESICARFDLYKERIIFRFTIGSNDNEVLKFWEPGGPSFEERLDCLKYAYDHGFETSVSCEPCWGGDVDGLIATLKPYTTDSIWIGKMNMGKARMKVNGYWNAETEAKYNELMAWYSDENIIALYNRHKKDPIIRWKESIAKVVGKRGDCKD